MAKKDITPDFGTPEQVMKICEDIQTAENLRALDRAMIDNLFNGGRPWSEAEKEKFQIQVNVNWNEGAKLLQDANRQLNNALIFKERYFAATCKGGAKEKRDEWGQKFTKNIHEPLKRGNSGKKHMFLLKSRNAAVSLHGVGPIMWMKDFGWLGRFIPLEDLLIPTDTLVDFSNLGHFAVNLYLTQAEFFDMAHGDHVDKRWNVTMVNQILDALAKPTEGQTQIIRAQEQPEKWVELRKQNRGYYDSDAVQTVKLRMFFYKNPKTGGWYRCVVLREAISTIPAASDPSTEGKFLFDGTDEQFAGNINEILHVQFGDNSLVAPLKYHSVRGLGVMLYSPIECNNRVRCETVQHLLLNLKTLLRVSNPVDRDRPKMLDLSQYSVVEDGISIIPNTERHQIDPRLVEYVQSQMRQLMSEGSASYVQDINDGTSKERTATETNAIVQSVNVQVSAMLQSMYMQEAYYYTELVRRFLKKNSDDEEVEEFQKQCKKDGIPDDLMVAKNWLVEPERVLGAGDQFLANQEASALLNLSPQLGTQAQQLIQRKYVTTLTRDPAMADLLIPMKKQVTSGVLEAENIFGTLFSGIPLEPREKISREDHIEALLGMLQSKVQQIESTGNVGTIDQIIGLKTVMTYIGQNIEMISRDVTKKESVKEYGDMLGGLANMVKAFEQRLMEQQQEQSQQLDPDTMNKLRGQEMMFQTKSRITEANAMQKLEIKQKQFQLKMQQDMEKHQIEMAKMMADTNAEIMSGAVKTGADVANQKAKAEAAATNGGTDN